MAHDKVNTESVIQRIHDKFLTVLGGRGGNKKESRIPKTAGELQTDEVPF